ncbi:hypothetical protein NDU88_006781 [Pleurodeles waltl]|uniref:Uncharacterized protein n=1 Tax=Pleurodeles waltl TaxID=8319 RepID=A0AAV7RS69_PLEWA|nr:hypothetical protein NDU88_006781 [Pleurodeles waltl]
MAGGPPGLSLLVQDLPLEWSLQPPPLIPLRCGLSVPPVAVPRCHYSALRCRRATGALYRLGTQDQDLLRPSPRGPHADPPPPFRCAASSPPVCNCLVPVFAESPLHCLGGRRGGQSTFFLLLGALPASAPSPAGAPGTPQGSQWGVQAQGQLRSPGSTARATLLLSLCAPYAACSHPGRLCVCLAAGGEVVHPTALSAPETLQRGPGGPAATLFSSGPDAHARPRRHTPGARCTA